MRDHTIKRMRARAARHARRTAKNYGKRAAISEAAKQKHMEIEVVANMSEEEKQKYVLSTLITRAREKLTTLHKETGKTRWDNKTDLRRRFQVATVRRILETFGVSELLTDKKVYDVMWADYKADPSVWITTTKEKE